MAQIKLGELLIKANVLQESQLKAALAEQAKWGGKLGEILVRMNLVSEDILVRALSKQLGMPAVNLEAVQSVQPHVKAKISTQTARDFSVLPLQLRDEGKTLVVAMSDPLNVRMLDELRAITKCRIVVNVAGRTSIARAFARIYEETAELEDADTNFKVVDAQGRTVVKNLKDLDPAAAAVVSAGPPPSAAARSAPAPRPQAPVVESPPARAAGGSPADMLRSVEDVQRKEVAALKAMVELCIEKGIFSREEYLAKVKR
ncbi:general secretion pathway protein GspE [Corallococcus sp. H22C18031201]|uniref:GspE/PulE/PilB domain-containing protein n=1 Tax=Citreicoccus inhibens TaxID=2849499 RepID=UPI000E70ACE6|nr:general secretion pathway protein GspE [Citreicoccus inhibens]MBU8896589.1 general secretion pathway protein GspE [Citreicoccus inhibens]RJS18837.1 general secretion pathway protein GspE [Corallococcus sp. H22C18031201]